MRRFFNIITIDKWYEFCIEGDWSPRKDELVKINDKYNKKEIKAYVESVSHGYTVDSNGIDKYLTTTVYLRAEK